MRIFLLFFLVGRLWGTDHWFGGTAWPRHREMLEQLTSADYKDGECQYLLGSVGGLRPRLARNHITVSASYVNDPLSNVTGGISRGFTNAGSFGADANIHLNHWSLYGSIVYRSGTSLSSRRIGNQFPVQQVFGGQNFRLNELYARYTLGDEVLIFKIGRIDGGNDFLQNPIYYHYVCNAFDGNPIGIFFNTPFTAYPNSTWALFGAVKPVPSVQIKGAIYNANSVIKQNRFHGMNFTFDNTNGWLAMTEWNYFHLERLPGRYNIAGWWQTGRTDQRGDRQFRSNWGWYIMADQMVWDGVTFWTALLFSPQKRRNLIPFFTNWGLVLQGPFAGRPKDSINFAIAFGAYRTAQTSEMILELNYWWQITPFFSITPDMQWVHNPRGLGTIRDAYILGCQTGVIF